MEPTFTDIEAIRDTAEMLTTARLNMLRFELLEERSSYDRQLKGLTGRCRKAAERLTLELRKSLT
jgi:hypothetical protein